MLTITATINITEGEAISLWESRNSEEPQEGILTPKGQALVDWVAEKAMNDLTSQWQFDHGINMDITAGGSTDTLDLLKQIVVCDYTIEHGEVDPAELSEAKEERDRLKDELGLNDLPEESENELDALLRAYHLKDAQTTLIDSTNRILTYDLTPDMLLSIAQADAFEVEGCKSSTDEHIDTERCPDEEAQFWSVFAHIPNAGAGCMGDFPTRAQAEAFAERYE